MDGLVAYVLAKKVALGAVSGISNISINGNNLIFNFKDGTSSSMSIPIPEDGKDGEDGATPSIGKNGNWYIKDIDTGIPAKGENGKDGTEGVSVNNLEIKDNHLICTLSDDTIIDAGELPSSVSIVNIAINDEGSLICLLSNGSIIDAGKIPSSVVFVNSKEELPEEGQNTILYIVEKSIYIWDGLGYVMLSSGGGSEGSSNPQWETF